MKLGKRRRQLWLFINEIQKKNYQYQSLINKKMSIKLCRKRNHLDFLKAPITYQRYQIQLTPNNINKIVKKERFEKSISIKKNLMHQQETYHNSLYQYFGDVYLETPNENQIFYLEDLENTQYLTTSYPHIQIQNSSYSTVETTNSHQIKQNKIEKIHNVESVQFFCKDDQENYESENIFFY